MPFPQNGIKSPKHTKNILKILREDKYTPPVRIGAKHQPKIGLPNYKEIIGKQQLPPKSVLLTDFTRWSGRRHRKTQIPKNVAQPEFKKAEHSVYGQILASECRMDVLSRAILPKYMMFQVKLKDTSEIEERNGEEEKGRQGQRKNESKSLSLPIFSPLSVQVRAGGPKAYLLMNKSTVDALRSRSGQVAGALKVSNARCPPLDSWTKILQQDIDTAPSKLQKLAQWRHSVYSSTNKQ